MQAKEIKDFYTTYADKITTKRAQSPYPLRRYAHEQQYASVAKFVESGETVLDAGCGEGTLSFLLAKKRAQVTGCDISIPNIEACKLQAHKEGMRESDFLVADSERLPFADNSFDVVVSSHVLEHLPDFEQGLDEVMRVTKKRAVVAIPTICNPCSVVQTGYGFFYLKGFRSFAAFGLGTLRLLWAWVTRADGVDETYGGSGAPHIFRFPSVFLELAHRRGYRVVHYEASCVCLPYFDSFLPIIRWLDRFRALPVVRNWGYGTTYVLEK